MTIFQFITEYCSDLVEESKQRKSLIDLSEFPHDDVITDSEGAKIPIVLVDGNEIPVSDFLTMDKPDFLNIWKSQGAGEAFDNYVSALEILEGEDVLARVRNAILQERERLAHDVDLITEI